MALAAHIGQLVYILVAPFPVQLPGKVPRKAKIAGQVLGPLPLQWETLMELLAPGLMPGPDLVAVPTWEMNHHIEDIFSLYLSFPISPSLSLLLK